MTPRCVGCRLKPRLTAWILQLAEARRHQQDRLLLRQPATRLPSRPLRPAGSGPAAVPAQAQHQKSLGRGPKGGGGGGGGLRRGGQRCIVFCDRLRECAQKYILSRQLTSSTAPPTLGSTRTCPVAVGFQEALGSQWTKSTKTIRDADGFF